tara:strand:- start:21715 stop:22848 length:1134 start_codon:yes stop_codon:yes gene_type:complete
MQAIIKELLSPFSFIKEKQNKNGRYNKFYNTRTKFWCYKAFGKFIFKHKGKVYVNWQIPESKEEGMDRPLMVCDKTGFGELKNVDSNDYATSYYASSTLDAMQVDHIQKCHNVSITGTIMYKTTEAIKDKVKDEKHAAIYCPSYYYLANDPKTKYAFAPLMWFNWDGSPSKDTLENNEYYHYRKKMLDAYLDGMRMRTNRMATARRANNKAIALVDAASLSGDWSHVDPADTFKIQNVSTRRKMLSHFSVEQIVASQNPETVDTDELNGSKYELIKFPQTIDENAPFTHCYYLKMLNVSTGETHLEGVAPYIENNDITWGQFAKRKTLYAETVQAALAWRDRDVNENGSRGEYQSDGQKNASFDLEDKFYNQPIALS